MADRLEQSDGPIPYGIAAAEIAMTTLLVADNIADVSQIMGCIAVAADDSLPDAMSCGIIAGRCLADTESHVRPVTASGPVAQQADRLQCTLNEGPSLASLEARTIVDIADISAEHRWPRFVAATQSLGVGAVLSVPLAIGDVVGVLSVYYGRARAHTDTDLRGITLLAEQAAIVLAAARRYAEVAERITHLEHALESRSTIDQAIGIVMRSQHCTATEALEVLRRTSRYRNQKVRDLAAGIIADISDIQQ